MTNEGLHAEFLDCDFDDEKIGAVMMLMIEAFGHRDGQAIISKLLPLFKGMDRWQIHTAYHMIRLYQRFEEVILEEIESEEGVITHRFEEISIRQQVNAIVDDVRSRFENPTMNTNAKKTARGGK